MKPPRRLTEEQFEAYAADTAAVATCLNPDCRKTCTYENNGRGRRRRFCTEHCRRHYFQARQRLARRWADITWTLTFDDLPARREKLVSLQRRLEWLLDRYGGITEDLLPTIPASPHLPLGLALHNLAAGPELNEAEVAELWRLFRDRMDSYLEGRSPNAQQRHEELPFHRRVQPYEN
ncbi:MAG: hypothetical protein V9G19_05345 [Tetrasphaera sp.]